MTTDGADSAAGLVVGAGAILNIVSGTSFTIYDFIHGAGTVELNSSGSDPTLFIHGAVSLVGGGTIKMIGTAGEDYILGVAGTHALLINVDYTIEGTGTIGGGDGNLTFENFGTVNANNGLLTVNTGNQVYNDGLMEATAARGTLQINDSVVNAGTVKADGIGAAVELSGATFDNLFSVIAKNGGSITFTNVAVTNEAVSATDPTGGTIDATRRHHHLRRRFDCQRQRAGSHRRRHSAAREYHRHQFRHRPTQHRRDFDARPDERRRPRRHHR